MPAKKKSARKKNPLKAVPVSYFIHIQKNARGPVMIWNGKSFNNQPDVHPHPFATEAAAVHKATRLISANPVLDAYKIWISTQWFGEAKMRVNPSQRDKLDEAAQKFENFTGHEATHVERVRARSKDKTGLVLGPLNAVEYIATRDGETDIWRHKFKARSRPLLAASTDGKQLHIVGGRYEFTEAGIEDR